MGREIKFRFVFKNNENGDIYFKVYSLDQIIEKPLSELADVGVFSTLISKDQFTGRKDADGADIFERDILNYQYYSDHGQWGEYIDRAMLVAFSGGAFNTSIFEHSYEYEKERIKILGDVHKTPELLEA